MAQSQLAAPQSPIFVEVSRAGFRHILELEADTDRAFVVGASRQADVFIDAPGAAAVEFHLERLGSDVWLTPAYRGRRLLVNGEPVRDRVQIKSGVLLRLGDYELGVKLLQPDEHVEPSARSSSAPRPLPNDYSLGLPTDTQKTSVAMAPTLLDVADTAPVVAPRFSGAPLPEQRTERMAPIVAPILGVQATERIVPVALPPRPASPALVFGSTETVRMKPVAMPPRQLASQRSLPPPLLSTPVTTSVSTPAGELSSLATQETTAFDIAALRGQAPESQSATPEPPAAPTTAVKVAAAPKGPSQASIAPSGFKLFLSQLGVATQQRPVLIVGSALAASFVLALALVGASRVSHPAAAVARGNASSKATATIVASGPSSAAVPSVVAPALSVAPPLSGPESVPHGAPAETPSRAAVRNLSAGRLAEAAEQYRAAGSHPNGVVYAEVALLLSRRLSATCTAKNSAESGCPEILK
jgi:hypothetical protein